MNICSSKDTINTEKSDKLRVVRDTELTNGGHTSRRQERRVTSRRKNVDNVRSLRSNAVSFYHNVL